MNAYVNSTDELHVVAVEKSGKWYFVYTDGGDVNFRSSRDDFRPDGYTQVEVPETVICDITNQMDILQSAYPDKDVTVEGNTTALKICRSIYESAREIFDLHIAESYD